MSEGTTIVARREPDGTMVRVMPDGSTQPLQDRTDWARVMAMTEEEIEENALSDPDSDPWTPEELTAMRAGEAPRLLRLRLNLTQEEFAERLDIPLGTLRDWERGARRPTGAARTLLRVIEREPEAVARALAST